MAQDDDATAWAFRFFGLARDDDFAVISRAVHSFSGGDDHRFAYARDIVLAISRYAAFKDDSAYNAMLARNKESEATPFQSLLLFLLRRLRELKYRRRGDSCYDLVRGMGSGPTFAWTRVCSIREFVLREVRKEAVPDQWRHLTNPRDNLDAVTRHLSEVEHPEFGALDVDMWLIAFPNGVYSIRDNAFWPHECQVQWTALATSVQEERRLSGWGAEYRLVPPQPQVSAINYVDAPFRMRSDHPGCIQEICDVLQTIGIDATTQWWFFVLCGRLLFPVNLLDRWQVMLYMKTSDVCDNVALCALVDVFRYLVGGNTVASVASGVSTQAALETLRSSRIGAMLLRDAMPLEQGDWHAAASGEEVVIIPGRSQPPFTITWTNQLLAVGAHIGYKNDAGTVDRRVVMYDVSTAPPESFHKLRHLLHVNADIWLQTIVEAYLTAVHEYGDRDIWAPNVLPTSMHSARQSLREITTPLLSCIMSEIFKRDQSLYMPLSDFKEMYQDYRRRRGLPTQRWVREHWQATFEDLSLRIERGQRDYCGQRTTEWLCGLDTIERSKSRVLTITQDTIGQLKREHERLDIEMQRVTNRLQVAEMLYEADMQVDEWKAKRHQLRERYYELESEVVEAAPKEADSVAMPSATEEEKK